MASDVDAATIAIDNCRHDGQTGFQAYWELAAGPTHEAPCFTWQVRLSCADCGAVFAPDPLRGVHFDHETGRWILHAQPLPPAAPDPVPVH